MSDEREEREEERSKDLFEDLDTFFAPIEDIEDEPEGEAPAPSPPTPAPTEGGHEEEEILPTDWSAGISDVGTPPEPAGTDEPVAGEEDDWFSGGGSTPSEAPAPAADEDDEAAGPLLSDSTSELSGEEWDRFRDVFGEVELDEDAAAPAGLEPDPFEAAAEEEPALPVWEEEEAAEADTGLTAEAKEEDDEEGSGLSLEDLQAVPPVYRDLPGPEEEEDEEVAAPGGFEPESVTLGEGPEGLEEAPSLEAVEAAADRFAESIRRTPEEVEEDLLADLHREDEPVEPVRVGAEPSELEHEPSYFATREEAETGIEESAGRGAVRVGTVDPMAGTGPSWQEPSSEEVELDEAQHPQARNIPAAFITGLILAVLGVGAVAIGKAPFAFFAGAIVLLAQGELYGALVRTRHVPATAIGLAFGGLTMAAAYLKGEAAMAAMVVLSLVFTFLWYMATPARARRNTVTNVALTLLGVLYVPFLAGFVLLVLASDFEGRALMLAVIGLTFLNDTVAYAAGSVLGGSAFKPLAPTVSPRKSWEGVIVGALATVIAGLFALSPLESFPDWPERIGFALVIAIFATLGDLAESLLKRDLRIKDMGTILPGHGGVLDRIDSVLFAAPAAFYFLRIFLG